MAEVTLTISGHGKTWQIEPYPKGTIIGRIARCDVVLESRDVSREHARIFQDPFGRWIVEDLGSSNGTFINGKRTEACAVLPGERVVIGPFFLSITQFVDQQIKADDSVQATNIIIDDFETEIFYGKRKLNEALSRPCPERLSEITELLSELTSSSALYPEVCRCLAQAPKTVAAVLRLPEKTKPLPKSPDILACHFGHTPDEAGAQNAIGFYPSHLAFRVSHHVLEEVRSTANAVMAKSIYSSDAEITSTVVDEHSPRAVICAPLGDVEKPVDLLYLDIPIEDTTKTAPEQMFDFVRTVAREVISTRKSLVLMQVKAERSILDHELGLAQKMQSRLAPAIPPSLSGIDLALHYNPVMWVGGDYCDVWSLEDGRLAFAVGQVSGNGLPTAMAMSNLKTLLRTTIPFYTKLSDVIKHVNSHLIQNLPEVMSATLFLGLLDPSRETLEYVNAGHLQPIIVRPQLGMALLGQPDSSVLGVGDSAFRTDVETIQQATLLLVFTDGVTKAKSPDGKEFGVKRLMNLLKTADDRSAGRIVDLVTNAVGDFQQTLAQQDDITVFCFAKS